MNASKSKDPQPTTREQVIHLLAEASELEHNILCSYLFALFSLKQRTNEDLTEHELSAVKRWRATVKGLCVEEMLHLAQVNNLLVAIGARAHFNRPNLPVPPGYHPAGIALSLAPFDMETLEHFIFLERPEDAALADSEPFEEQKPDAPRRSTKSARLMPAAPEYATIGEFYARLRSGLTDASDMLGESTLFCGATNTQLTAQELRAQNFVVIDGIATSIKAIDVIVEQGEGGGNGATDSHFEKFEAIREEYAALLRARPGFVPCRNVARDPVMHAPVDEDRTWVDGPESAVVIDAANGCYTAMLRCLARLYETSDVGLRRKLLDAAMACMHALTSLGEALTELPASRSAKQLMAGVSFAVLRSVEGLDGRTADRLLGERLGELAHGIADIGVAGLDSGKIAATLQIASDSLGLPIKGKKKCR